jgi:hypothetical protein
MDGILENGGSHLSVLLNYVEIKIVIYIDVFFPLKMFHDNHQ